MFVQRPHRYLNLISCAPGAFQPSCSSLLQEIGNTKTAFSSLAGREVPHKHADIAENPLDAAAHAPRAAMPPRHRAG